MRTPAQKPYLEARLILTGGILAYGASAAGRGGIDEACGDLYEEDYDEARTIGPVGWGTPPAGSTVTAQTSTASAATWDTATTPMPCGETSKVPAGSGLPPAIAHSS